MIRAQDISFSLDDGRTSYDGLLVAVVLAVFLNGSLEGNFFTFLADVAEVDDGRTIDDDSADRTNAAVIVVETLTAKRLHGLDDALEDHPLANFTDMDRLRSRRLLDHGFFERDRLNFTNPHLLGLRSIDTATNLHVSDVLQLILSDDAVLVEHEDPSDWAKRPSAVVSPTHVTFDHASVLTAGKVNVDTEVLEEALACFVKVVLFSDSRPAFLAVHLVEESSLLGTLVEAIVALDEAAEVAEGLSVVLGSELEHLVSLLPMGSLYAKHE